MTMIPFEDGSPMPSELNEHVQTYHKFVRLMRIMAFATPLFLAFIIYWTT